MGQELRLLSWNVNGIRSAQTKGLLDWLAKESPDVLCLQETKAQPDQLSAALRQPQSYAAYWNYPERKGYAGVAIFSKQAPVTIRQDFNGAAIDLEGRVLIADYTEFTLMNIYFPNGKQSEERLNYKMAFYDAFLSYADSLKAAGKKLIVCGDVNTAHKEIDLARPKANEKISGFLAIERAWMDTFVSHGYIDTFRRFHQEPNQYSWWDIKTGARQRNVGWRIDYFFVTENLIDSVSSAFLMPEVPGSDHCPVGITLRLE